LNPTNNFIKTSIAVTVKKNIERDIAIIDVADVFDIAAGHANHTPIIAKANAAIICHKLLFSAVTKFHFVMILAKYCPYIFSPKKPIKAKNINAIGKIYSITPQSHGIKTKDTTKSTFIVIARVNGILIRVISQFVSFSFSNSSVFLKFLYIKNCTISVFR
jgi:hypothetical protein